MMRAPVFFLVACAGMFYSAGAKSVFLSLTSHEHPPKLTVSHFAYPGLSDVAFGLSGQHPYVGVASTPDNLASETAKGLGIAAAENSAGWAPSIASFREGGLNAYRWEDWLVFPHHTFAAQFWFHPSLEEFHIGLSADSPVWREFPLGATFCAHTQVLVFAPEPPFRSCLGDHIVTLDCAREGALRCGGGSLRSVVEGDATTLVSGAVISPFDHRIELPGDDAGNEMCDVLRRSYYAGAAVTVQQHTTNKTVMIRSGEGMIMPLADSGGEARILDEVLICNAPEAYLANDTANVGLLGTELSFVYDPASDTLSIYETRSNSMRNNWYDVIIINACLLLLVHFIFDAKKTITEPWTYVPELLGSLAAIAGLFFQKNVDGAYYRVADLELAPAGVVMLSWWAVIMLAAHFSAMLLACELPPDKNISRVRTMSHESSILSSVFLQVLSGSMDILDAYMAFMVGTLLVYNTAYRCVEMARGGNHPVIVLLATSNLAAACFSFYVGVAAPAMDPVASLSSFVTESSVLVLQTTLLLALIECVKRTE